MNHLIWSNEHGGLWRPGCRGYTLDIDDAGRYNAKDAGSIVLQAGALGPHGVPNEVMLLAPEHRWQGGPPPSAKRELAALLADEAVDDAALLERVRLVRSAFGLRPR